ncbi:hypothetical protein [Fumia xinanensis]|uniref:Uncharacterized protein n=1 Tax=Fumia xinanensis TaxID=2763659 RepID=A0A926E5N4_9FIRM|nr:hypothetical protein [Fumia xinanensis]MBC8560000.1 hypothetical protein [Fumia xinanensis]PWL41767.1 MAG: hypothetical protein DBY45_09590 [Clostridiales bacterium]
MSENRSCRECRYFYDDCRDTVYRRSHCYFCKRKGLYFSRNCRIGEENRILPDDPACKFFQIAEEKKG